MNCTEAQQDIATALLTGQPLTEGPAAHVAECPACAAEQASLRQVLGVMSNATAADIPTGQAMAPDDLLLHRILDAAAHERQAGRRRTRTLRLLAAAAVVALLVGGFAVGATAFRPDHLITASAASADLSATVDIAQTGEGSALRVSVTGIPRDTDCVISVHTSDGRTIPVVAWTAEYEGTAHVIGTAPATPDSISSISLTEPDGHVLLEIPVTA